MKLWTLSEQLFSRWIDLVAEFAATLVGRLAPPHTIKLVEGENNEFSLNSDQRPHGTPALEHMQIVDGQIAGDIPESLAAILRGSRVELLLKSDRFLFRPLELPARAAEFLDGIIRSQIDRLTPWNAAEAACGWSKPNQVGTDRIVVTIAATARTLIAPYVRAISELGAQSIAICTTFIEDQAEAVPISVMDERTAGFLDVEKIRRVLIIVLITAAAAAAAAVCGSALVGMNLDAQQEELQLRIAKYRAAASALGNGAAGPLAAAQHTLESRKQTTPPSVITLEALSRILPDNTYLSELRIENDKIQLVGLTHDAPSLIKLMEQSGLFTRATFFAPTTNSPSDAGERFHIEAHSRMTGEPRP